MDRAVPQGAIWYVARASKGEGQQTQVCLWRGQSRKARPAGKTQFKTACGACGHRMGMAAGECGREMGMAAEAAVCGHRGSGVRTCLG